MSSALATTSRDAGRTDWLSVRAPAGAARTNGQPPGTTPTALASNGLPRAGTVLAVTARPLLLETSMSGVIAAGDVRHRSVKRVATAIGEGGLAVQLLHQDLQAEQDR